MTRSDDHPMHDDFDRSEWHPESGRRADPQDAIEAVNQVLESYGVDTSGDYRRGLSWDDPDHRARVREAFEDFEESEPVLPGFGPEGEAGEARDDCGRPNPFICDSCGAETEYGRTCKQSECARCASVWTRDGAIRKAAKLVTTRKTIYGMSPAGTSGSPYREDTCKHHHLVLSPPPGWWAQLAAAGLSLSEAYDATSDAISALMDAFNIAGHVARHSFRGARDDGSLKSEKDDRGAWKDRLYSGRTWGSVRDELAWMPHYHVVAASDWVRADAGMTPAFEDATGWVMHRITRNSGGASASLKNDGAMAAAVTYTVSHTDLITHDDRNNETATDWMGSYQGEHLSNSKEFVATDKDRDWADGKVREKAEIVLGLSNVDTDCGRGIPAVDDPDELARRTLEEMYPGQEDAPATREEALRQISEGNITVEVSTTDGGGGDVTVRDAFGAPVGESGFGGTWRALGSDVKRDEDQEEPEPELAQVMDSPSCEHDHDHGENDDREDDRPDDPDAEDCEGTYIPIQEARRRGLLDNPEWRADAPNVEEADHADRRTPDGIRPYSADLAGDSAPPPAAAD